MQQAADRLRAIRYELPAPLVYRSVGGGNWLTGRAVNVSRSGVLLQAMPPPLPAGTRIEFILTLPGVGLPGASRVECQGRVVRHCDSQKEGECTMAATIEAYNLIGVAPETAPENVD
jgi:hypothetical protein